MGALDNDVALELAQGHEDRSEEHAGRGARVNLLLDADDFDALLFEMVDNREEVFGGATEARETLDDEEVAIAEELLELLELGALFGCARDFLDEETVIRDTVGFECVDLAIKVLGLRRYAGITKYHCK